jgi:hypothetical protein
LVLQKKFSPGLAVLLVFKGCFGKNDVLGWCFCGQSVVDCVVIVTWKLRFVGGGNFAVFENISVERNPPLPRRVFEFCELKTHPEDYPGRQNEQKTNTGILHSVQDDDFRLRPGALGFG